MAIDAEKRLKSVLASSKEQAATLEPWQSAVVRYLRPANPSLRLRSADLKVMQLVAGSLELRSNAYTVLKQNGCALVVAPDSPGKVLITITHAPDLI